MNPSFVPKEQPISAPLRSIVIPAYNEAHRIGATLDRLATYLSTLPGTTEVVVVDDGSQDSTAAVIREKASGSSPQVQFTLLSHSLNRGKGAAVREGCLAAKGRTILFTDADFATPIEEAQKLWDALERGNDVAIGCRVHEDGRDMRSTQPLYRRLLGRAYHLLVALVAVRDIKDTQCGFKAFTRDATQRLFTAQTLTGIVFDAELLFLAQRAHMRIAQIPVTWSNIGGSRMRVTPKQAWTVLWDLLSIRVRHLGQPRERPAPAKEHTPH